MMADFLDFKLRQHPIGTVVVMLLLALAATGLLVILPQWTPPSAVTPSTVPGNGSLPPPPTTTRVLDAPPDDEQITAIARLSAQILLRASLARVVQLQTLQVERWDRAGLHRLQENIAAGEKAYREQRFRAAQDAYRAALIESARVEAALPAVITALLKDGDAALAEGNSAQAAAAFGQVLAIRPAQRDASLGQARAVTLDRVRALIEQAEAYEQMGEEDQARAAYLDAARLDARAVNVSAGLARLDRRARARDFRTALSAGHVALEHGDFNGARGAFKRAAALKPQAAEVQQGQRETERRATAANITTHLERAARAVRSEAWSEAARAYGAALALDAELGAAADGKRNAEQRAQLDTQLSSLATDVLALVDEGQRDLAERALATAKTVDPAGPRLRGQIVALDTALGLAREAVNVTLLSDGQSEVSIDGVGALGRFTQHPLALRPGHYRALAQRDGRADVRIEFTIAAGASAPRITLQSQP